MSYHNPASLFQFQMVQLKDIISNLLENLHFVSIPNGSIKRRKAFSTLNFLFCFNSKWFN